MKTSIFVFTLCALSVFAIGAGLKLTAKAHQTQIEAVPSAIVAQEDSRAKVAGFLPRPVKVLPTITVVADAVMIAQADREWQAQSASASNASASVMTGSVVDAATRAIGVPASPRVPRARLGNPFYDFGRRDTAPATTE